LYLVGGMASRPSLSLVIPYTSHHNLDHLGVVEPLTHRRCEMSLPPFQKNISYVPSTCAYDCVESAQQQPSSQGTNDRVSLPDRDCKGLVLWFWLKQKHPMVSSCMVRVCEINDIRSSCRHGVRCVCSTKACSVTTAARTTSQPCVRRVSDFWSL